MKKRTVVLILIGSFFLFSKQVFALKFNEDVVFSEYSIKTFRANPSVSISGHIFHFTDDEGKTYYFLNPTANFFRGYSYLASISNLDKEILKEISRVIYYGYGYKNQTSLEYYAATQYLLFKAYKEYTITFIDTERKQVFPFQKEIAQIEKNLEKNEFQWEDLTTTKHTLEIDDEYIVKHFIVQGENVKTEEKNGKIEIILLNDLEEYTLEFIPKADCSKVEVFGRNNDTQFIHMDLICENVYSRTIHLKKDNISSENHTDEEEKMNLEQVGIGEKKENTVRVPATGKKNYTWIFLLFLLGDVYYVFKR